MLDTNTLALETNALGTGNDCVESTRLSFSHKNSYSYQQLLNITYVEMIANYSYSPPKADGNTLQIFKKYLCTVVFSVGLKGLQKYQVNEHKMKVELNFQLHTASNQQARSGLLCMHIHAQFLRKKSKKCQNKSMLHLRESFEVVAH